MILCCGEALIDMLPVRAEDGRAAFAPTPGGAPYNTALALARLQSAAGLFCALSSDPFGALLRTSAQGVDLSLCPQSPRPTGLAFVHLKDSGIAQYSFHVEGSAERSLTLEDLPDCAPEAALFGGISLAMEPCGSAYEALHARLAPRSTLMLDINIRPAFISNEAAYRARLNRMIARSDIVKISDEDLSWLAPDEPREAALERLCAAGPQLILLTLGAHGARAITAQGLRVSVAAMRVAVVDTIGAGDTFNAGLLAALEAAGALEKGALRRLSLETLHAAMVQGTQAAGYCVGQAGARGPLKEDLCALSFNASPKPPSASMARSSVKSKPDF